MMEQLYLKNRPAESFPRELRLWISLGGTAEQLQQWRHREMTTPALLRCLPDDRARATWCVAQWELERSLYQRTAWEWEVNGGNGGERGWHTSGPAADSRAEQDRWQGMATMYEGQHQSRLLSQILEALGHRRVGDETT